MSESQAASICGYCGGPHIDGRDHEEERRMWFGDHYSDAD